MVLESVSISISNQDFTISNLQGDKTCKHVKYIHDTILGITRGNFDIDQMFQIIQTDLNFN
jgi:hypothetical protein